MSGSTLVLVELLLVLGGVMGWAVWELWSVRRQLRDDRDRLRQAGADRQGGQGDPPGSGGIPPSRFD